MSYAGRQPRVYLRDLQTGEEESLGHFDGMSFAPRFAGDGHHVAMSIARSGGTQIYTMDLRGRQLHQITSTPGAINKLRKAEEPAPAPAVTPEDVLLLREIRDSLKASPRV